MQSKRPESVLVVVHDDAGRVLLLRRADVPDFWQSVTGSLKPGETRAAAARRELAEETGLDPEGLVDCRLRRHFPIRPEWRGRYAPEVTHNVEHEFRVEVPAGTSVTLNPQEHVQAVWLKREEALARATSWTNRAAIRELDASAPGARVVLVHGLWIGRHSMRWLARRLRAAGFRTRLFGYASTRESPPAAARRLRASIEEEGAPLVHLVGHSLGGVVIAHALASGPPACVGRAVLLGSPMRGAAAARGLARLRLGWTLGAARGEGLDGRVPAWPREVPVAVIAGIRACGPGMLAGGLRRPHDGTVTVRETALAGARRCTLPLTHLGLLGSPRAAAATAAFLAGGRLPPCRARGGNARLND